MPTSRGILTGLDPLGLFTKPKTPDLPPLPPLPTKADTEEARKKQLAAAKLRYGRASTILTSPQGAPEGLGAPKSGSALLGG